jgi:hypothetical protein
MRGGVSRASCRIKLHSSCKVVPVRLVDICKIEDRTSILYEMYLNFGYALCCWKRHHISIDNCLHLSIPTFPLRFPTEGPNPPIPLFYDIHLMQPASLPVR